jgi:hypothetical protein
MELTRWQQKIVDKVNENQELDAQLYTWATIPKTLRLFWIDYFNLN